MRDSRRPKQPTLLGEDEAASMAEALLSSRQTSVTTLLESLDRESADPADRREGGDFDELVKNSVFGRPEPDGRSGSVAVRSAPGIDSTVTGRPSPLTTRAILRPESTALPASGDGQASDSTEHSYPASFVRSGVEDTERRRKITLLLASLFTLALVASTTITVFGNGSTVEAETQSVPTVSGVTQTAPSSTSATTVLATTVPAPPTTPPTTMPAPTTEAPTTEAPTTEAPTSTVTTTVPTTPRPTTTRPATTQRPPTTARPTTAAPAPTQVTLPDVTFSQPTWAATDPPPPPVDPEG